LDILRATDGAHVEVY